MKLMMSREGVVTEDGERVEGIQSVTTCDNDMMSISLRPGGVYEGDVKPPKEDLEPKLPEQVKLKIVSDGYLHGGTRLIDVETGREVDNVSRIEWIADANGILSTVVHFGRMEVSAGVSQDIKLSFKNAIDLERRERNPFNRFVRFPIEIKWYAAKRLFKKLW